MSERRVLVNENSLIAIGSAIREKNGTDTSYKPGDMAAAILEIETGIEPVGDITITENGEYDVVNYAKAIVDVAGSGGEDIEIPVITGNCSYRFGYDGWTWFIEQFGDQMETADITNCQNMFNNATTLKEIPFEINCQEGKNIPCTYMFNVCNALEHIPKINHCKPETMDNMFPQCHNLREIPEDIETWFDWSYIEGLTSSYGGNRAYTFNGCYSLRSIPMSFLAHENPKVNYNYSIYYYCFSSCYVLDEIIDLPINGGHVLNATTSNLFYNTFNRCCRLKNMTFKSYATDTVAVRPVKWKSQVIDLTNYVGYAGNPYYIYGYSSGITQDKEVIDDATYQALKNDPDWFTANIKYSRYNHDSAVATINSLPDASVYLSSAGGTNTIKFKGQSGELTDGGAINTLTEEEIAVATARGWTVSLT